MEIPREILVAVPTKPLSAMLVAKRATRLPIAENTEKQKIKRKREVQKETDKGGSHLKEQQRVFHNLHNRTRLRAIADSISSLRKVMEAGGKRIGPLKLDILDAAVKLLHEKRREHKAATRDAISMRPNGDKGDRQKQYIEVFETSAQMAVLVRIQPTKVTITNFSEKFLVLTGYTRDFLANKSYSILSNQEPQDWIVKYRLLVGDPKVKEIILSNLRLTKKDGSTLAVNAKVTAHQVQVRKNAVHPLVETYFCIVVTSKGSMNSLPKAELLSY